MDKASSSPGFAPGIAKRPQRPVRESQVRISPETTLYTVWPTAATELTAANTPVVLLLSGKLTCRPVGDYRTTFPALLTDHTPSGRATVVCVVASARCTSGGSAAPGLIQLDNRQATA